MKQGDLVTARVLLGVGTQQVHTEIGTGKVHTPGRSATEADFAQVWFDKQLFNVYLLPADENKTWVKGHDKEKLAALLAAEAMSIGALKK